MTPMNTPTENKGSAGLTGYQWVGANRYGKRCNGCGCDVPEQAGYATMRQATKADKPSWATWCYECAASYAGRVARRYAATVEAARALGDIPQDVADALTNVRPALQAVVDSPNDYDVCRAGITALADVKRTIDGYAVEARKVTLAVDPLYLGLALATEYCRGKYREAAESMMAQWEAKGYLSPRQVSYATDIAEAARAAEKKAHPEPDWASALSAAIDLSLVPDGYYAVPAVHGDNDLTFVRVGTVDPHDQRIMRHIVGGHPESTPSLPWCQAVLDAIVASTPQVAGKLYAAEIGRCYRCNRHLTDKASRDRGLGPVCANS